MRRPNEHPRRARMPLPLALMPVLALTLAIAALVVQCRSDTSTGAADATVATDGRPADGPKAARDQSTGGRDGLGDAPSSGRDGPATRADARAAPCSAAPAGAPYPVGVSAYGTGKRIEYIPGDLPVILAAPHGGTQTFGLPARSASAAAACSGSESFVTNGDSNSAAMTRAITDALRKLTGRSPHVVFNAIRRDRLDANRSRCVGAAGGVEAARSWTEFQTFVDAAKRAVNQRCGAGLYIDVHTHAHSDVWVELGYLVSGSNLARSDAELDAGSYASRSSIAALAKRSALPFSKLLRGATSFGASIASAGFTVVPSPGTPSSSGRSYFSGGYNTQQHGSRDGGSIDAVQIESHFSLMNSATKRARYGEAIARAIVAALGTHYGYALP